MKKFIPLLLLLLSGAANADQYYRARTITGVAVGVYAGQSILLFSVSGDTGGMTACAATKRFAISSNSPAYKDIVAIVLAAYHSKESNIDVNAIPTCSMFPNAQDVQGVKSGNMPF